MDARFISNSTLLSLAFQDTAILLSGEVQGATDPNAAPVIAVLVGTTMAAGVAADTFVTSLQITSGGTSSGTGMHPGVRKGAEAPEGEEMVRFVKTVTTVAVTEYFQLNNGNAHALQVTME